MAKHSVEIVLKIATIIILAYSASLTASGQTTRKKLKHFLVSDSVMIGNNRREKADQFYDSLANRQYKSWISRTATRLIIVNRKARDEAIPNTEMEIAQQYFSEYKGRTISKINVVQANVFERHNDNDHSWLDNFTNSLHILTNESKLRKNLLFQVGDKLNPYNMAINEQLVRRLPYISEAMFIVVENAEDSTQVSVNIFARDRWTISGGIDIGNASSANVFDENFLGTGNELDLKYYYKQNYQGDGFEAAYKINNIWGSFSNAELTAGVGSTNNTLMLRTNRPFILPNDHIYGLTAGYTQVNRSLSTVDTVMLVNEQNYGGWYGYSLNIDKNQGTAIYYTIGSNISRFTKRPFVSDSINPYFQNRIDLLTSIGISRQNYFQGNMIYGAGRTEDVPYGYRLDLTTGIEWNEFLGRRHYFSTSFSVANMTRLGYFYYKLAASTYMTSQGVKSQGMVLHDFRYFSPLWKISQLHIRQFVNISAIWGFNRLMGDNEELAYTADALVRGVGLDHATRGYNRLTLGTESVIFTPLFFYHFRFGFNVWGDVGWLGYKNPMFSNPVSSSVGVGVRIRNERLVFKVITLRMGYAVRLPENARFNPFEFSTERTLDLEGFAPTNPRRMDYQ